MLFRPYNFVRHVINAGEGEKYAQLQLDWASNALQLLHGWQQGTQT